MTAELQPTQEAWYSKTGEKWDHDPASTVLTWPTVPQPQVMRISLGDLGKPQSFSPLPAEFSHLFPNLESLHLWNLTSLSTIPGLPGGLTQLDIQKCRSLDSLPALPGTLDTFILVGPSSTLQLERASHGGPFPGLLQVKIQGIANVEQEWFDSILDSANSPLLQRFECTRVGDLQHIPRLPSTLTELVLRKCPNLATLPATLPVSLRLLDLFQCGKVSTLPDFPAPLDYVNLGETAALKHLPANRGKPSTLFIHGSGLELPPELFGTSDDDNQAADVDAFLTEMEIGTPGWDHEVKVILLGNGRCGKTSLVRRLQYGPRRTDDPNDPFDRKENSTHGIKLWTHQMDFHPVDGLGEQESNKAIVNIWDFAGQDLYHNTHRLFFQSKAIFILCCTDHEPGADGETDQEARKKAEAEGDVSRPLSYWRNQLAHLPAPPGLEKPPLIVVRTKAERDEDPKAKRDHRYGPDTNDFINFSAKDGTGLDKLEKELREKIALVLGKKGQRRIPGRLRQLKSELQILKTKNERAFSTRQEPPFPYITREDFDICVFEILSDSLYAKNTRLALDFLHNSGFLHADGRFLKNEVVLDLRWVIDGIYTVFDREKSGYRAWIRKNNGLFSEQNLVDWTEHRQVNPDEAKETIRVWTDYNPDHRKLFLNFMQACDICFVLLKGWETASGDTLYLAPSCLPAREEHATAADREIAGLAEQKPLMVGNVSRPVTNEAMVTLLVHLGRKWRRSALYWQWGGQFRSFYRDQGDKPKGDHVIQLNWNPLPDGDGFGGTMEVTLFGTDFGFVAEILAIAKEITGFAKAEFPQLPTGADLRKEKGESHPKNDVEAAGVEVSLSYAGGGDLEKWPCAIRDSLPRSIRFTDYREEQKKAELDKEHIRREFLDHVATRDFVSVFVSDKYLESDYCLYELWKLYDRIGGQEYDAGLFRLGYLDDSLGSQDKDESLVKIQTLSESWGREYQTREENLRKLKGDREEINRLAELKSTAPLYSFLSEKSNRDKLFTALFEWKKHRLCNEVNGDAVGEWIKHIGDATSNPDILLTRARETFHRAQKMRPDKNDPDRETKEKRASLELQRAIQLCLASFSIRNPSNWAEDLDKPWDDTMANPLRLLAKEEAAKIKAAREKEKNG